MPTLQLHPMEPTTGTEPFTHPQDHGVNVGRAVGKELADALGCAWVLDLGNDEDTGEFVPHNELAPSRRNAVPDSRQHGNHQQPESRGAQYGR